MCIYHVTLIMAGMSDSDPPGNRPNSFRDAYEAAKRKTEYQTEVIEHLDNKALRTFRYVLLTAGVVLTAFSIQGIQPSLTADTGRESVYLVIGATLSVSFFFFAIVSAIMASRISKIDLGPSEEDIDKVLTERPNEGEWLESALQRQSDQIEENSGQIQSDRKLLVVSQFCFVVMFIGLFFLFIALF